MGDKEVWQEARLGRSKTCLEVVVRTAVVEASAKLGL